MKNINQDNENELTTILSIKQIIFNMNKEDVLQSAHLLVNKFDENYTISFYLLVCQIIYSSFLIKIDYCDVYLNFINEIATFEKNTKRKSTIFNVFTNFLLDVASDESYYLLRKMVNRGFIDSKNVYNIKNAYFPYLMSDEEINELSRYCWHDIPTLLLFENIDELRKNDWKLHKQLFEDGVNPNEIAQIIRNDETEKLQEIASINNFNFNQEIEPSLYERCTFINNFVSLIDYAAFFGSVKTFKYLLMNGAKVRNTLKYAIAGGNKEIIHLCQQNHSTFEDVYETSIKFHRNDVFNYLFENKIVENYNLEKLGIKCILHHNYEVFTFLLKQGMKINDDIINKAAKQEILFLLIIFSRKTSFQKIL